MAYSTLVSLEKLVDQILNDDRYCLSPNGKQLIVSLDKHVISFRAFLEDFPEKAAKINVEARIRHVSMKAEDIIEWFMNEQIRHYVFRYVHWIAELRRLKFEFQLRQVRDKMDTIAEEVVEMKNSILIKDAKLDESFGDASSSSQVAEGAAGKVKMVGMNEDLIEIKDWLCRGSRQLQILPINGMGGIGKTTLARNAYDDPLVMEHFQIRVWITISQNYSQGRILSDLLDSMKDFLPERRSESVPEDFQQGNKSVAKVSEESDIEKAVKVYQSLYGKRFLIIMDDLWSTKVLDDAKKLFPNDTSGSRILLTTRLGGVADSATPSHEMRLMGADQSWDLLREKVLEHHDCIPNEVESIGKEIARSCGGLPLAVVVVAGLLSTVSQTLTSWKEIARNVKSSLATTGDAQIEKILSLSYNHLPHYLRGCFLYMGGFPEDYEINVTNLIRLWIAEGFVKPVTSKTPEDSAEEYMEDLIKRNLVIVSESKKSNGRIKSCKIHDLVRDLCLKRDLANISSSTIRTIMYLQDTLIGSFGSFRLLKVLDVLRVRFKSRLIPDQFFELFHLRYLAFWCGTDIFISRAISNLQSLETLIIKRGDDCRIDLPREIWNMPQLRHLIFIDGSFVSAHGPTLALENLQTLGEVKNLMCSLSLVQMFPNLKKLHLSYSWGTENLPLHNLVHLRGLEILKLELSDYGWCGFGDPELVLPSSLKKLVLFGWGRFYPYLSIDDIGSLPYLEVLKLRRFDFAGREWTTRDQDFPKLRFLEINSSDLMQWHIQGSSPFPVLEKLIINSCWSLSGIPDSIGEIPTLKLIVVNKCKYSLVDCVRLIREDQLEYGDDVFQVRFADCNQSPQAPKNYKILASLLDKLNPLQRFLLSTGAMNFEVPVKNLRHSE